MDHAASKSQTTLSPVQLFERTIRAQADPADLVYHFVNDFPNFLDAQQGFAFKSTPSGKAVIIAAGSVPDVDRNSETLRDLEDTLGENFSAAPFAVRLGEIETMAAMPYGLALPYGSPTKGRLPDGILLARSQPWTKQLSEQAAYLAEVYNHAFQQFAARKKYRFARLRRWMFGAAGAAILASLIIIPIPITVVAPARVISQVSIPAAPSLEGVVDAVFVQPSERVERGQKLYALRDGAARAELDEARARVRVAVALETKLRAEALRIPAARQELNVAEAETELARISLGRVEDIIARHTITAPIDGMIVADSLNSLPGTPLNFGDAPVQIVDPEQLIVQADVALADSVVVFQLRRAKIFLTDTPTQAHPLSPLELPFEPTQDVRGGVSYPMQFSADNNNAALTLGAEGVVQLSGPDKPLGYVLFRRPIQWVLARLPW